jgi:hypothetical protein
MPDQPALEVSDVPLGQVIVGTDDDGEALEEVMPALAQTDADPRGDIVGLTDICLVATRAVRVLAREDVEATSRCLGALQEPIQPAPWGRQDLPRPVQDVGDDQPPRMAINQEEPKRVAGSSS